MAARIALTICEDAWNDKQFWERPLYRRDPVQELAHCGAELLISINASPYHMGKRALRREIFAATARRHGIPVVYVNQVGGNDQLVFDGSSFAMDATGRVAASAASFAEDLVLFDSDSGAGGQHDNLPDECEAVYEALVLGTRDYIRKCGFERVLIGLSGGIDSSLTAAIAVDALGAHNVTGVGMPGPFSSEGSIRDARALAQNLGIRFEMAPISPVYDEFLRVLDPLFAGARRDVTEENLQARLRGVTLMALSNKWGALVLTTGNKSELAVGYCTLYGDMCGGLAVISDVPKTLVYDLSRVANRRHAGAIPGKRVRKASLGRVAPRSERQRFAPALRNPGPGSARLRGRLSGPAADRAGPWPAARNRGGHREQGGPQRVQAAAGRARPEGHLQGIRHRPPLPHRPEVRGVMWCTHSCVPRPDSSGRVRWLLTGALCAAPRDVPRARPSVARRAPRTSARNRRDSPTCAPHGR
jgi:NAD+ synthetase